MKNKMLITLTTILTLSLCSITITAFAENAPQPPNHNFSEIFSNLGNEELTSIYKEVLAEEVANGTLTQQEADKKYEEVQERNLFERKELSEEDRFSQFKERLDKQVEEGTLTQSEADEKYQAIQNGEKLEKEQLSDEDRLAQLKKRLDKQVDEGKLTQAEADEKYQAMQNGEMPEKGDKKENSAEESKLFYKKVLDKLVSNGTITQTEADEKYTSFETIQNQRPERNKQRNKVNKQKGCKDTAFFYFASGLCHKKPFIRIL